MAVEKLPRAKFAKTKLRYDALQTTFSVFRGIFYPPNFRCFEENGVFQHPRLNATVMGGVPMFSAPFGSLRPRIRTAFLLASSRLHLCAMNCLWMWACASLGRPIVSGSAANSALQYSHTPSTGILFSRWTILNLRFAALTQTDVAPPVSQDARCRSRSCSTLASRAMRGTVRDFAVGNGQVCTGDNAGNDVFRVIAVQGV